LVGYWQEDKATLTTFLLFHAKDNCTHVLLSEAVNNCKGHWSYISLQHQVTINDTYTCTTRAYNNELLKCLNTQNKPIKIKLMDKLWHIEITNHILYLGVCVCTPCKPPTVSNTMIVKPWDKTLS